MGGAFLILDMDIQFNEDFATKKKGDRWEDCPGMLATRLVNRGIAKKYSQKARKPKLENKNAAPKTEDKGQKKID